MQESENDNAQGNTQNNSNTVSLRGHSPNKRVEDNIAHSTIMLETTYNTPPSQSSLHAGLHPAKRSKMSEPDMSIVVGSKTYKYHSLTLATQSCYVRNKLVQSTLTRGKLEPMTLSLTDVSPSDWDQMLKYIDPDCAGSISTFDAMRLKEIYVRYGFEKGVSMCDRAIYGRTI